MFISRIANILKWEKSIPEHLLATLDQFSEIILKQIDMTYSRGVLLFPVIFNNLLDELFFGRWHSDLFGPSLLNYRTQIFSGNKSKVVMPWSLKNCKTDFTSLIEKNNFALTNLLMIMSTLIANNNVLIFKLTLSLTTILLRPSGMAMQFFKMNGFRPRNICRHKINDFSTAGKIRMGEHWWRTRGHERGHGRHSLVNRKC